LILDIIKSILDEERAFLLVISSLYSIALILAFSISETTCTISHHSKTLSSQTSNTGSDKLAFETFFQTWSFNIFTLQYEPLQTIQSHFDKVQVLTKTDETGQSLISRCDSKTVQTANLSGFAFNSSISDAININSKSSSTHSQDLAETHTIGTSHPQSSANTPC
jgi:hypothetical protein